jgi:hypothetical protein
MEFDGEVDEQGGTIEGSCSVVGAMDGRFTMKITVVSLRYKRRGSF